MGHSPLSPVDQVSELVRRLYALVAEFEVLFPGRRFTLDGHLVGSIGEVLAAHRYGISLCTASTEAHDGFAADGRRVEIKMTQGERVALRAAPQHLIVLHLSKEGSATEVFNGPGELAWSRCGPMQSNGQRRISIKSLQELMTEVPESERLKARA